MLAPLSWLKDYVDISLKTKELADRLTEVGVGVEKIDQEKDDVLFELEITPNRPDCLSIIGVAREIAAIEDKKVRYPKLKTDLQHKGKTLPFKIHPDYKTTERLSGIIINNVTVKPSPKWLVDKLELVGMRPINNIVDITNFVMKELGNPIHSFDYHKIEGAQMWVRQAKGGEEFESVDEVKYRLPKGAIIFEDTKKIFDLVGIKGGKNSGTYKDTKAVFIAVEVDDPVLIRRASQALSLRSDASAIFERAVNKGGTIDALKRTTDLVLQLAGGEISSELFDLKEKDFEPWKLSMRIERLNKLLGIKIPKEKVLSILKSLNLNPATGGEVIECTIPTYRNDLKIEEDLIEEVARLYGYGNFPKTLPSGELRTEPIPYFKDYKVDEKIKQVFKAAGFSEIYTYSLIDEELVKEFAIPPDAILRVDNPISREFEYLRPTLRPGVVRALRQNKAISKNISLFELGKAFTGKNIDDPKEAVTLAGITNEKNYFEVKGIIERLFEDLGMSAKYIIDVIPEGVLFEINVSELLNNKPRQKVFKPLPKYPPIKEDITLTIEKDVKIGNLIDEISKIDNLISLVKFMDKHKENYTFHIEYSSKQKSLTNEEAETIRKKIISSLQKSSGAKLKE